MMRPTIMISTVALFIVIVTVFKVEQDVQLLRGDLAETNRQLEENLNELHVLRAEWTYLTKPERLQALSEKYLQTKNINIAQVVEIDDLPIRTLVLAERKEYNN